MWAYSPRSTRPGFHESFRPSEMIYVRLINSHCHPLVGQLPASEMSQELRGLESLEIQMARNYEALKERHEYAKFSRTFKGQLFNWGGQLFAIYCIFRVISVSTILASSNARVWPNHDSPYWISSFPRKAKQAIIQTLSRIFLPIFCCWFLLLIWELRTLLWYRVKSA